MRTIQLPGTDFKTLPLSLGAMRFLPWEGNRDDPKRINEVEALLETALDLGVNFIDHADIYGAGECERLFGEILQKRPEWKERFIIQTKCGIVRSPLHQYDNSGDYILKSVDQSLKRLQVESIDILLIHRPDPLLEPEDVGRAFAELKRAGKVKYFGVSNFSRAQMDFLQSGLEDPLVANQLELSLARPELFTEGVFINRPEIRFHGAEGVLEYCTRNNIQVQAWSPLGGGRLGNSLEDETHLAEMDKVLGAMAEKYGCTRSTLAIAWLIKHPANVIPIVGTTRPDRLKEFVKATEFDLSRSDWWELLKVSMERRLP